MDCTFAGGRSRALFLSLLMVVALGCGSSSQQTRREDTYQRLLSKDSSVRERHGAALERFQEGDVEGATRLLGALVAEDPTHLDLRADYAMVLEAVGRRDDARSQFSEVLNANPQHFGARYNLGNLLARHGDLHGAIEEYREAARIREDHGPNLVNLANALMEVNLDQEAREILERAVVVDPDLMQAHNSLGVLLFMLEDLDGARRHQEEAVRLAPTSPDVHLNLGYTFQHLGDLSQAVYHLETFLELAVDRDMAVHRVKGELEKLQDLVRQAGTP